MQLVCDFDKVRKAGKNLCKSAEDYVEDVKTYSSDSDNTLSGWTGDAKAAFESSNAAVMQNAIGVAGKMYNFGKYLQTCADAIEELDKKQSKIEL